MVTVEVPVAAVALAVRVKELVVVVEAGLKDAVTPLGKPDADRLTLPVKAFWGATVIVSRWDRPFDKKKPTRLKQSLSPG